MPTADADVENEKELMDANVVVKYGKKIKCFIGVFLIEGLKKLTILKPHTCLIVIIKNHAIALRFEQNYIELLDPLGLKNAKILSPVFQFLKRHLPCKKLLVNTKIQSDSSSECAKFSLVFLYLRNHGFSYNDFLNIFSNDFANNDVKIKVYFDKFFVTSEKRAKK